LFDYSGNYSRLTHTNAVMKNPFRSARIFLGEMVTEVKKAAWPTRQELREMTVVVIIAVALLGVFTSVADFALVNWVDVFTNWVTGTRI
jgi:preprotein translocase subunit SecE